MKTANTTAKAAKAANTTVTVDAGWKFTPDSATVLGQRFAASYSVAKSGDVYAYVTVDDMGIRLHIAKDTPLYHDAFDAAMTAKTAAKQPAKQAEAKVEPAAKQPSVKAPAADKAKAKASLAKGKAERDAAKAAKQPAKAEAKPAAKAAKQPAKPAAPAKAAKQPAKAEAKPAAKAAKQPAKPATPAKAAKQPAADKAWIGTEITGKGWRIVFDDAAQRTRVSFTGKPSAKQKAAVEAAGFYFSASLKTWNKKLTCKAYRAALALRDTLTALK